MRKTKFALVLAFAPVLLGADSTSTITSELVVSSLPLCGETEYLQYSGGTLVCANIGGGTVQLPDCSSKGQLLTFLQNGEISSYNCTDKGQVSLSSTDITTINNLDTVITQIGTTLNQVKMNPRASAAVFVGTSTATANGRISNGGETGARGANKVCEGQYGAGARMCTVYDMFVSLATGKIKNTDTIMRSWVYQASFNNEPAPADANAGLSDNCATYIYPTGDKGWKGTTFEWKTTAFNNTDKALQFNHGTGCQMSFPIACCK